MTTNQQWQPIETAPKDGTRFIGRRKDGLVFTYWNQAYYEKWPHEEGGPTFRHDFTYDRGDAHMPDSSVKHWMPLHEPL